MFRQSSEWPLQADTGAASLEARLRASEARLRAVVDAVNDGVIAVDGEDRVTGMNLAAERLTGFTEGDALGRPVETVCRLTEALTGASVPSLSAAAVRGARRRDGDCELLLAGPEGRLRSVDVSAVPLSDASGAATGALLLVRDVTPARDAVRALGEARAEFHARQNIAHDLNNALAPVLLVLSTLQEEYPAHTREIEVLESSANRAAGMVRQLLTLARGPDGPSQWLGARPLLEDIERIVRATFPRSIEVRTVCAQDLPDFPGDPTHVHQLLLNLCVNARNAMSDGGRLTLAAGVRDVLEGTEVRTVPGTQARSGRYVCLSVEDTGTGIAPDVLDRMFEPFFTTNRTGEGTGLGLSTVLGIVKGRHGFMQVDSVPHVGSRLVVCFPAGDLPAESVSSQTTVARLDGRGRTVLVVDDEPGVRNAAAIVLNRLNLTPILASDGADALTLVLEHRDEIVAVVTDVHMPVMDGMRLLRSLRRVLPAVPVIVSSGDLDPQRTDECRALGAAHVLQKPFTEQTLADCLSLALTAPSASPQPRY